MSNTLDGKEPVLIKNFNYFNGAWISNVLLEISKQDFPAELICKGFKHGNTGKQSHFIEVCHRKHIISDKVKAGF